MKSFLFLLMAVFVLPSGVYAITALDDAMLSRLRFQSEMQLSTAGIMPASISASSWKAEEGGPAGKSPMLVETGTNGESHPGDSFVWTGLECFDETMRHFTIIDGTSASPVQYRCDEFDNRIDAAAAKEQFDKELVFQRQEAVFRAFQNSFYQALQRELANH